MGGTAQYIHFLCMRCLVLRFIFYCVGPPKLTIGRSVTFVAWACERGVGGSEWQIHTWFAALGVVFYIAGDRLFRGCGIRGAHFRNISLVATLKFAYF